MADVMYAAIMILQNILINNNISQPEAITMTLNECHKKKMQLSNSQIDELIKIADIQCKHNTPVKMFIQEQETVTTFD